MRVWKSCTTKTGWNTRSGTRYSRTGTRDSSESQPPKSKLAFSAEEGLLIRPVPLLNFFVAVVMFSIGLRTSGGDLLNIVRDRSLLVRILLANCILIPAIGLLLVRIFPLSPDAAIGIVLLAAIPGTPIALQFTRMAKTRLAFTAAMTLVLSVVGIAMAPLVIETMPQVEQRNERPVFFLIVSIALYIALPMCAGLWTARWVPRIAPRLVLPLG